MMKKTSKVSTVIISVLIIALAFFPVVGADHSVDIDDFIVDLSLEDNPRISVGSEEDRLYSIEYTTFEFITEDDIYKISLQNEHWDVSRAETAHDRFYQISFTLETDLEIDGKTVTASLALNVLSMEKASEVTFNLQLHGLKGLPEGTFYILQEIDVNGEIMQRPRYESRGEDPIDFYEFSLIDGSTGYYTWSTDSKVDGEISETTSFPIDDFSFAIGIDYENPEADTISISEVELNKTRMAVAPLPEVYSRFPSFILGVIIGGGFVLGLLIQKRKQFYENRDVVSTVRLEDSPYYRGKR